MFFLIVIESNETKTFELFKKKKNELTVRLFVHYINFFQTTINREGDISLVEADAVTNTTDETLTEKNIISNRIFRRAGPNLHEDILNDNRGN